MRAGIGVVMLPGRNRKELDDIPEEARKTLRFVWLETVDDALRESIGNMIIGGEKWVRNSTS